MWKPTVHSIRLAKGSANKARAAAVQTKAILHNELGKFLKDSESSSESMPRGFSA
jgi:hypothetical protein